MAIEYSTNNILPGLDITANSTQIAKILDSLASEGAGFNYAVVTNAMNAYRQSKYDSASESTDNTKYKLSENTSAAAKILTVKSAYSELQDSLKSESDTEIDNNKLNTEKQYEKSVLDSIVSADLFYASNSKIQSIDEACEKYLGIIYAARENGYEPAESPVKCETGADSMLFCRQVLNDIGINWVTRYLDNALLEAKSIDILVAWPYKDYPKSLEAYKNLDLAKRKSLEEKAYRLMSTPFLKDTELGLPNGYEDATRNPYYLEAGDIIISPDGDFAAVVLSDQSIAQCTNRTLRDCPYYNNSDDVSLKCSESNSCFKRQFNFYDDGSFLAKTYGRGGRKYDADNSENTGGVDISNDPRNKCISSRFKFDTLCVTHDSVELRRLVLPWYSYLIKTSELLNKTLKDD